jgi:hypothetical protein
MEANPQWGAYVWRDVEGDPLPFQDEPALLHLLRSGDIVSFESITSGVTRPLKVVLEAPGTGVKVHAIFRDVDAAVRSGRGLRSIEEFGLRDRAVYELVAYGLDRMLGMHRVPPVVPRTVDGRDGTLQLWLEGTLLDRERRQTGLEPPDTVRWARQLSIMHVFDNLIGNYDRNQGNMLIDDDWRLWLIDHTRAFLRSTRLLSPEKVMRCERRLLRSIRDLDDQVVRRRFGDILSDAEMDALFGRRDAIVERFDELINELGEDAVLFEIGGPSLDADLLLDELEDILEDTGPVELPPEED